MSKRIGDPGYAASWCIHYRSPSQGIGKPDLITCEAGVEFKSVQPQTGPTYHRQPCFLTDKGESKLDALPCEKLRRPTPDEIVAHEKWIEGRINNMRKVMTTITPWRKEHKTKKISGAQTINCPVCGGIKTLSMTIAAYNGHVHAQCKTEGCVSWME